MKRLGFFLLLSISCQIVIAQTQPKLVVGIVVDQMRQEYFYPIRIKVWSERF
jgi:hypothetical protein